MAPGDGEGILIGNKVYSEVYLTLGGCQLPPERLKNSPSAEHGLAADKEEQLRLRGCEMIQAAGILLKLPQVAMATGQILFHRFYYCKSFVRHCAEMVAMACVHLASKIEEEPRRVRDVLNVFHHLKFHKRGKSMYPPLSLDAAYINMKAKVIKAERRLLKELGFCVHVKHPHKVIVMFLQVLECEKNTKLVQMAWNYMNDSLRTDVFLRFSGETVACACIYLSARLLQIPLPDEPPWFQLFGASEEDLKEICTRILRLYSLPYVSFSSLLRHVEQCRQALDEAKVKLGSLGTNPSGTPTLEPPTCFSPASASKAVSPSATQPIQECPLSQVALRNVCRKLTNGDGKTRKSRSAERRKESPLTPPKRRRSRSVSSPSRSKKHRDRERDRERNRARERERKERDRDRGRERRDEYSRRR